MNARILLVEDEPALRLGIEDALRGHGFDVVSASDGPEGERIALTDGIDLVLLDVMLPGRDGFSVLRNLRRDRLAVPVICLTARGEEFDRVQGFESGADDYLVKPFSMDELVLRIRALLRRAEGGAPGIDGMARVARFGDVAVDFDAYTLRRDGDEVALSQLEADLLRYFLRFENEALSRERLLSDVWDPDSESTLRTVDQHVLKLRKKIERNPAAPRHLVTVRKVGYRFTRAGAEG